ncbi:MAG TPA: transcriptional regulator [Caldithrix abyssi]|uniref:Transcriptional regulator n=1 Tax=Caldithrix abyssi TaxID=187145 RepID=A0A7V1LK93_CALAY|nr:transcriptional regulator [Caldithrix abyssi]
MPKSNDVCSITIIDGEKVNRVKSLLPSVTETDNIARFFKGLGDSTRQKILQALLIEELCVCDLSTITDVSISAISHQLRMLRDLSIVKSRRVGKMVYYSLADEHIRELMRQTAIHLNE